MISSVASSLSSASIPAMKNSEAYRLYTTLESARKEKKEKVSRKEEKKRNKEKEVIPEDFA